MNSRVKVSVIIIAFVSHALCFSIYDQPEGWASQAGGTTGGSGGTEVTVNNMSQLQAEAKSSGKKVILIEKGIYTGKLTVSSDKTIIGKEPGVLIKGSVVISKVSNVILRNFAVQGNRCNSYEECKDGDDAVGILNNAHHVWLDHLDISDGQDGNCDITKGADFVTVTWCKFWYSYDKEHRFSNLISSADNVEGDKGKLNITYAYCWWADRVDQRQPRGRSGKVHVVNNLYTSKNASYACGPGVDIQMLIENNLFNNGGKAIEVFDGNPKPAFKSVGNMGTAKNINMNQGMVFTPPYTLSLKMEVSEVESRVRAEAGNTLNFVATSTYQKTDNSILRIRPFISSFRSGWFLCNPTLYDLSFTLITLNGKTVLPSTRLEAGKRLELPSVSSPVLVVSKSLHGTEILYVPVKILNQ